MRGELPTKSYDLRPASRKRRGWRWLTAALAFVLACGEAGAQNVARPEAFRFDRPVLPGAAGSNRLDVDLPLLVGGRPFSVVQRGELARVAGGLGDLRLYDAAGREVPYLLVPQPTREPRWLPSRVLPVPPRDSLSGFQVDLGDPQLVDRVRVGGLPAPFLKRVQLEGSGDAVRWTQLVREGTLFDLPDERLRQLELEFRAGEYRYLRVVWDDSSSGRLPLPPSVQARHAGANAPPRPLTAALRVERRPSEPGKSRYRIRLPGARLPIVALELQVGGGNVLREARVTETRLEDREMSPALLGEATLRRAVRGNATAQSLRIPLSPPSEAELELTIDDGSNPPLDLVGITAIFAPLPYIYFESERGGALLARYGNPRLSAPRYDLEAVRDSVHTIAMAAARWAEPRERAPAAAAAPEAVAIHRTGAPIDAKTFRWTRTIPPGDPGLTALTLDAAVLAHSRIADVRIARPDGRQVPYIVERLAEPLRIDLPVLELVPTPSATASEFTTPDLGRTQSHYRLHFPYDSLPASRIVLSTPARVFRRHLRVEVVRPPALNDGRRGRWRETVASSTWSHAEESMAALPLTLHLPAMHSAEAYLVVEEGDNSQLPLAPPTLLLPTYRLRFYRDRADAPLTLLYGRPDLTAPTYDIALLAPELVGAAAAEIAPGGEAAGAAAAAGRIPHVVFWAVLGLAVLAMIGLIGRLLKGGGFATEPATTPQAPTD
ncbi:MAG: DUF3999 domain-containing protein [Gemmatimonadota bacterium]|nr:DUF3999 domain-containing protein [Gemmatimonadota bacterium]